MTSGARVRVLPACHCLRRHRAGEGLEVKHVFIRGAFGPDGDGDRQAGSTSNFVSRFAFLDGYDLRVDRVRCCTATLMRCCFRSVSATCDASMGIINTLIQFLLSIHELG